VTKPFQFEGAKRMKQADDGIDALQKMVDTLIIIPNQNLFRLANEKTTFTEAFSLADDVLYQGVKGVTDLMVRPGLINLDFADVRAVMDEMGKAMMGTGEASGEDRATQAAEKAIANPLLDEISLRGAKGVLINITGGHDLTLFELDEAANRIREEVDPDANIIVGSTLDEAMNGMMRVSVVATGIDAVEPLSELPVPRRRMAEPLKPAQKVEEKFESAYPADAIAAAEEQYVPAAQQAAEPTLFEELDPVAAAANEQAEAIFDDDEDAMPAPAYRPQPAPFQPRQEAEDDFAAQFVAPKAGAPTPDALARLRAAVDKAPRPTGRAPVQETERAKPVAEKPRFGINSLIGRMTGHPADAKPQRAQPPQAAQRRQPPMHAVEDEHENNAEQDRIEIPAFLRRQAN